MPDSNPTLTEKNLLSARKMLFMVADLLDEHNIPYHLEGGTLLGIVRDKELLPWDHDVDISIPQAFLEKLIALKPALRLKGYRLSMKKSQINSGPIKKGEYYVIKIKSLWGYFLHWFLPTHYKKLVVLDIFIKAADDTHTYWQAKGKTMRVENHYYQSFETVPYQNRTLKVPNRYKDYLTEKYGDWSIPVKEWDCGENELTILNN